MGSGDPTPRPRTTSSKSHNREGGAVAEGRALPPRANLRGNALVCLRFGRFTRVLDTSARSALALRQRIPRAFRVRRGRLRRRYGLVTLFFDLGL